MFEPNSKVLLDSVIMSELGDHACFGRRIWRLGSSWNRAWEAPMRRGGWGVDSGLLVLLGGGQGKGMGIAKVAVVGVEVDVEAGGVVALGSREPVRKRRDGFLIVERAVAKVVAQKVDVSE